MFKTSNGIVVEGLASETELSDDEFLDGQIRVLQPQKGFRAGYDTVFLAAAVPAKPGQRIFEAGIGSGIASLCLLSRVKEIEVDGLEISPEMVALARKNAERNGFSDQFNIFEGDARLPGPHFEERGLKQDSYDHVFANPPFYSASSSRCSPNALKAGAHTHTTKCLDGWIRGLVALAKPKASITIVHRTEMLDQILTSLNGRAGNCLIRAVQSFSDKPAPRIIVQAIKASRAPLKMLPPFIVHIKNGENSKIADGILRRSDALILDQY